jgi:hypothetical protein
MTDQMTATRYTIAREAAATAEELYAEARDAAISAWKAQSATTAEEGYTIEQANAAIYQARIAQEYADALYDEWQNEIGYQYLFA